MKGFIVFIVSFLLFAVPADAQKRLVDATDGLPISAASILDANGNMVGFTLSDGAFSEFPQTAYPITVRCVGYEQLVIEHPENKVWEMTPIVYELEEVVVTPVERNTVRQLFYVREYFSMSTKSDTITYFVEHMADRFVPASEGVKSFGSTSLRTLDSRCYARFNLADNDSVVANTKSSFPSMLSILDLSSEPVSVQKNFKGQTGETKLYEKSGISGMALVQKQNSQTFTMIMDLLADEKEHKMSPWALKVIGCSMDFRQLYVTQAYRANDDGVYLPKEMIDAGFVMEADGKGKLIRMLFDSDKPVMIRSTVELYTVDLDYLSKDEAKAISKKKPDNVGFVIPSTAPPLNAATRRTVERVKALINNKE